MSGFNFSTNPSSAPAQSTAFFVASSPSSFSSLSGLPSSSPNLSSGFVFPLNSSSTPSLFGGASSGAVPSLGFGLSSSAPAFGSPSLSGASWSSPAFGSPSLSGASSSSPAFGSPSLSGASWSSPAFGSSSLSGASWSSPAFVSPSLSEASWSSPAFGSLSGASLSPFHKPNSSSGAAPVTFQYPPVKEEPRSGSPAGTATRSDFDGIAVSAEKADILGNIKRKHPSCFSSLRLQSESHRRSAYDHLVKVIEELKAVGGKGGPDSYDEVLIWLDDLEIYGLDMAWLRDDVVKLRRRRMEVVAEKEARRKAREELVKQIEAIDAELAAAAKDDDAAAAPEFLSDLFGA